MGDKIKGQGSQCYNRFLCPKPRSQVIIANEAEGSVISVGKCKDVM